jgi:hypothetical protein
MLIELLGRLQVRLAKNKFFWKIFWFIFTSKTLSRLMALYSNPSASQIKVAKVIYWGKKYNIDTFIETGTYLGDTVESTKHLFKNIYSIEIGRKLANRAKTRFIHDKGVTILCGDSGLVLPKLLKGIKSKAVFWLDAHYSKGISAKGNKNTPVMDEIHAIVKYWKKGNIVLIDDARLFTGEHEYPKLSLIKECFETYGKFKITVKDDVIQIIESGS